MRLEGGGIWKNIVGAHVRIIRNSVAGLTISIVIGTTGPSLVKNNNISKTVRHTTNPTLLSTYLGIERRRNSYPAKRTIVALTNTLPTGTMIRAIKPI